MKSFFFVAMTALFLTACASKEDKQISAADLERQDQFSRLEGQSYRVR